MRRLLITLIIILTVTCIFADKAIFMPQTKNPVLINSLKNAGETYLNINDLSIDGLIINNATKVSFLIFDKNVLEVNTVGFYCKVNFVQKISNSVIVKDGKVYVKSQIITDFLKLQYNEAENILFLYTQIPKIIGITYSTNKLTIETDRLLDASNFSYSGVNDTKMIKLAPFENFAAIPPELDLTTVNGNVLIKFKSNFNYSYKLKDKTLSFEIGGENVNMNKSVEGSTTANTKENAPLPQIQNIGGLQYQSKTFSVRGTKIKVHYAKVDPKFYNIKVLTNNLGKASDFKNYLKGTGALLAINASYFDPSSLDPIGNVIKNSNIVHVSSFMRPAFYVTSQGVPDIGYVKLEYNITINDMPLWVKSVNSTWKGDVKLYTSDFKGTIKESEDNYLFMNLSNGIINSFGKKSLSDGQNLLLVDKKYSEYFKTLKSGTAFDFYIDKNINTNFRELAEGGPIIINNDFSKEMLIDERRSYSNGLISGRTPRTMVAIDDKNMVTFIVAEGYTPSMPGLNYDDSLELLKQMGNFKKALMFDGGSSSFFYYNGNVLNYRPSNWRTAIPIIIGVFKK